MPVASWRWRPTYDHDLPPSVVTTNRVVNIESGPPRVHVSGGAVKSVARPNPRRWSMNDFASTKNGAARRSGGGSAGMTRWRGADGRTERAPAIGVQTAPAATSATNPHAPTRANR